MADSDALGGADEGFRKGLKDVPTDVTKIKVDAKTIGEITGRQM